MWGQAPANQPKNKKNNKNKGKNKKEDKIKFKNKKKPFSYFDYLINKSEKTTTLAAASVDYRRKANENKSLLKFVRNLGVMLAHEGGLRGVLLADVESAEA